MASNNKQENLSSTREAMDTLLEISKLLNTGLDAETLSICVRLCENGANPEALVRVIQELRRETAAIKGNLSTGVMDNTVELTVPGGTMRQ